MRLSAWRLPAHWLALGLLSFVMAVLADTSQAPTWEQRLDGGKGDDQAASVAVDTAGDVYVAGTSFGGDPATGGTALDIVTSKYAGGTGALLWTKRYDAGNGRNEAASGLAVDNQGHVFVTGLADGGDSTAGGTGADIVTITYDATSGDPIQVRKYDGAGGEDIPYAIAADSAGNVYVAGSSFTSNANQLDFVTLKYAAPGGTDWVRTYDGANLLDIPSALALDPQGNVFVTGYSDGGSPSDGGTGYDFATISYSPTGDLRWVQRFDDGAAGVERPVGLAIDPAGDVFVAGIESTSSSPIVSEFQVVKYANSGGAPIWAQTYQNSDLLPDLPSAVTTDEAGAVYLTGTHGTAPHQVIETVKFDGNGAFDWAVTSASPSALQNIARAIAADAKGLLYVAGYTTSPGASQDIVLLKYDSSGTALGIYRYDSPFHRDDFPASIAVAAGGNVFLTGTSQNTTDDDILTLRYETANHPPVAVAGADQTIECSTAQGAGVQLDGSGSSDPDGGMLSYTWLEDGVPIATGVRPRVTLPLGDHTITLTVEDPGHATDSATLTVHVRDTTPPTLVCPDVHLSTDAGSCASTTQVPLPNATDSCSQVTLTGVRSDHQALTDPYPNGLTTILWTAVDTSTNETTSSQRVIVSDHEPPVVTCPSDLTINEAAPSGTVAVFSGDARDNCGQVSAAFDHPSGSLFPVGTTLVTLTATDQAGNQANCSFHVNVVPPATTPGRSVSGSGALSTGRQKITFSTNVKAKPNGKVAGQFTLKDPANHRTIKSSSISSLVVNGNVARIYGMARNGALKQAFIATVTAGKATTQPPGSVQLDLSDGTGYPAHTLLTGKAVVH